MQISMRFLQERNYNEISWKTYSNKNQNLQER